MAKISIFISLAFFVGMVFVPEFSFASDTENPSMGKIGKAPIPLMPEYVSDSTEQPLREFDFSQLGPHTLSVAITQNDSIILLNTSGVGHLNSLEEISIMAPVNSIPQFFKDFPNPENIKLALNLSSEVLDYEIKVFMDWFLFKEITLYVDNINRAENIIEIIKTQNDYPSWRYSEKEVLFQERKAGYKIEFNINVRDPKSERLAYRNLRVTFVRPSRNGSYFKSKLINGGEHVKHVAGSVAATTILVPIVTGLKIISYIPGCAINAQGMAGVCGK